MIRFEDVSKAYPDGTRAVDKLNLNIEKGEFFVFIGPSGCGKTTTLKMVNRLIDLTEGTLYIDDKKISDYNIHELRYNIGYVLQQIALFPHMTIEENISIVPELKKWKKDKISKRVDELLTMVGMDPNTYRSRKPAELSGGQQQRVGVVRALAADPEIILMDEPFSALDPISREKLQNDMLDLQQRINKTIIFVTHDMQEALKLGDRICVMKEGKVVQVDAPQTLIKNPANSFIEEFIGSYANLPDTSGINQNETLENYLSFMEPLNPEITKGTPINVTDTLATVLQRLKEEDAVAIEKEGEIIGMLTSRFAIDLLAQKMGGESK